MLQLNPPLPVDTPKGPAYAHFVTDYSQEHYLLFTCFLLDTGDCWMFTNRDVKLQQNVTMGVRTPKPAAPCTCEDDRPANRLNGQVRT